MSGRFQKNLIERKQFDRPGETKQYLNQKDLKYIKDCFKENDVDKKNEIDIFELKQALDKYGIKYDENESLKKIFNDAEEKGSADVDFDELINLIISSLVNIDDMSELLKVFVLFLGDENVDQIEFRHLKKECPTLKDEEIKEMIEKIDENKDGKVNFEEFHKIVTKAI